MDDVAYLDDGSVVVFARRDDGAWTVAAKLNGTMFGGQFGYALAMDGDVLVVGEVQMGGGTGAAYVYRTSDGGAAWTLEATLVPDQFLYKFGSSVAVAGDPRGPNQKRDLASAPRRRGLLATGKTQLGVCSAPTRPRGNRSG